MKKVIFPLACVFVAFTSHAQIQTPEECILETFKSGSVPKELASMVRYNCVSVYINKMSATDFVLSEKQVSGATLKYLPGAKTVSGETVLPSYELTLKNDSNQVLIQAVIMVTNIETKARTYYRLSAETPIQPNSAGILRVNVLPISNTEEYWKQHTWQMVSVKLVSE